MDGTPTKLREEEAMQKPVDEIMSIAAAVNRSDEDDTDKDGRGQSASDDVVMVLSESGGSSPPTATTPSSATTTGTGKNAIDTRSMMRRTRTILSPYQSRVLRRVLEQTLFPSTELRNSLANMLGIKPRTIQIWFQNQRQKAKLRTSPMATSQTDIAISGSGSSGGSGSPTPIAPSPSPSHVMMDHNPNNHQKMAPEGVRWVQFHESGLRANAVPRQHAIVMQVPPGHMQHLHMHPQPQHPPIHPQHPPNQQQYYRHPQSQIQIQTQPQATYTHQTIPYEHDHLDHSQTPRGGLDILASIASITTTTSDLDQQRVANRVGLVPKPQQ